MIPQIVAAVQTVETVAQTAEPMLKTMPQKSGFGLAIFGCIYWLLIIGWFCLVIFGVVQLIRFLGSARKEQKLIRMELGKLADEVQQIHKELKNGTEQKPLANSEGE